MFKFVGQLRAKFDRRPNRRRAENVLPQDNIQKRNRNQFDASIALNTLSTC